MAGAKFEINDPHADNLGLLKLSAMSRNPSFVIRVLARFVSKVIIPSRLVVFFPS